jgi:DNA modification methylase
MSPTLHWPGKKRIHAPSSALYLRHNFGQRNLWRNMLIHGDNLAVMGALSPNMFYRKKIEWAGGIKLVYIDPPFDVGQDFHMESEAGASGVIRHLAYSDKWGKDAKSFLSMLYSRLWAIKDLLAEDGVIYLHCDWRIEAYARLMLEEVFGKHNFMNTLIWQRDSAAKGSKKHAKQWSRDADSIIVFRKSAKTPFYPVYKKQLSDTQLREYMYQDADGRKFKKVTLGGYNQAAVQRFRQQGLVYKTSSGREYKKYYLDEAKFGIGSIWTDIVNLSKGQKEQQGYPTQKPEALLERIIASATKPGDIVADFFCGSGTLAVVAEKMGRKWIASDMGGLAVHTARKRLLAMQASFSMYGLSGYAPKEGLRVATSFGRKYSVRVTDMPGKRWQDTLDFLQVVGNRTWRDFKTKQKRDLQLQTPKMFTGAASVLAVDMFGNEYTATAQPRKFRRLLCYRPRTSE